MSNTYLVKVQKEKENNKYYNDSSLSRTMGILMNEMNTKEILENNSNKRDLYIYSYQVKKKQQLILIIAMHLR